MISPRFFPLVLKYISRYRVRSFLTLFGVATAMFLFYAVQAMQDGVHIATQKTAKDTTLVVYREARFCPFTSRLPEDYKRRIETLSEVDEVLPIKIVVSNCRASLDVVTFRGVPPNAFKTTLFKQMKMIEGSFENWEKRNDAALIGERLATRRNLKVGDRLKVAGITITVAGIFHSEASQDQNVAYTHLDFVQRSYRNQQGIVTQFNVRVKDPDKLEEVASQIDTLFAHSQEPTTTWPEKAFVARAATDIIEIVAFTHWLGLGALVAVFALVANTVLLSVQERIRDHAIFQTLGYPPFLIARLILAESLFLSLFGGVMGLWAAQGVVYFSQLSLSVEGLSIPIQASPLTWWYGFLFCSGVGILAGLYPALQTSRREISSCFRAV